MERFSITELEQVRRNVLMNDNTSVEQMAAHNISSPSCTGEKFSQNFSGKTTDNILSILLHDAVVELHEDNQRLNQDEAFRKISSYLNSKISASDDLNQDIIWNNVYGTALNEAVEKISEYFSETFEPAQKAKKEVFMENNGLYGYADIILERDDQTEILDIKTHYSENPSIPRPQDQFKLACYGLISREELEVDRLVLKYPLQGKDYEVQPEDWFGEIVETSEQYKEIIRNQRQSHPAALEDFL